MRAIVFTREPPQSRKSDLAESGKSAGWSHRVMGRAIAVLAGSAAHVRPFNAIGGVVARVWREMGRRLFDTYRPELHYMRGPGPKWRAKQGDAAGL